MSHRSSGSNTLSWSLVSSGLVTLVLGVLPGPSLFWGLLLVAVGVAVRVYT